MANKKLIRGLGITHIIVTGISCVCCIFLFPFLAEAFTQLDVVSCLSGCALVLMIFPDEQQPIGFINRENCVFFFFLGIAIVLLLVAILIMVILKKRIGYISAVGIYGFDIVFVIIHRCFLQNMMDITTLGYYMVLSIAYKAIGILLFTFLIAEKKAP